MPAVIYRRIGRETNDFVNSFLAGAKLALYAKQIEQMDAKNKAAQNPAPTGPQASYAAGFRGSTGSGGTGDATPTSGTGGGVTPRGNGASQDPVAADLQPHQKAFLNALAPGESAGAYDVRYNGSTPAYFNDFNQHPAVRVPTGDGNYSTAAGRYQIVESTWNDLKKHGLIPQDAPFTPENQDRAAWALAARDYRARTGSDLDTDLKTKGYTPEIAKALQPTWTSLDSSYQRGKSAYDDSIKRYDNNEAGGSQIGQAPLPPDRPGQYIPDNVQFASINSPDSAGGDQQFARGGLVHKFALGGPVPEGNDVEADYSDPMSDQNMLARQQQVMSQPSAVPMQAQQPQQQDQGGDIFSGVKNAVAGGLKALQNMFGLNSAVAGPQQAQGIQALLSGDGALDPAQMAKLYQTLDPAGKLDFTTRNLAGLWAVHDYYMQNGDADKANKYAAAYLQYANRQAQYFGAYAEHAAQDGNFKRAAEALTRGYAEVPDAKKVSADVDENGNGVGTVTDTQTGKTVDQFKITPEVLMNASRRMRMGMDFYKTLAIDAGVKDADTGIGDAEFQKRVNPGAVPAGGAAPAATPPGNTPAPGAPLRTAGAAAPSQPATQTASNEDADAPSGGAQTTGAVSAVPVRPLTPQMIDVTGMSKEQRQQAMAINQQRMQRYNADLKEYNDSAKADAVDKKAAAAKAKEDRRNADQDYKRNLWRPTGKEAKELNDDINAEMDNQVHGLAKNKPADDADDKTKAKALKDANDALGGDNRYKLTRAADQIARTNRLSGADAARIAVSLAKVNPADPTKPSFKVGQPDGHGNIEVETMDDDRVLLSKSAANQLMSVNQSFQKIAADKKAKADTAASDAKEAEARRKDADIKSMENDNSPTTRAYADREKRNQQGGKTRGAFAIPGISGISGGDGGMEDGFFDRTGNNLNRQAMGSVMSGQVNDQSAVGRGIVSAAQPRLSDEMAMVNNADPRFNAQGKEYLPGRGKADADRINAERARARKR